MRDEGIEVAATRWARHAVLMLALLALLLVATWWTRRSTVPPLEADEFKAVVAEIDAMIKTQESKVRDFVVHEATPERIERLYRSDAVAQLSKAQRENGLIFAGQSALLHFEAPSDIVHAIDRWFPQEMANARREKHLWQGDVHLYGPFASWNDEPATFVTLWNCVPQRAWLQPDKSPFDPEADGGLGYMGLAARSSSELDFGDCVRERSGWVTFFDEAQQAKVKADGQQMAARMQPLLTARFADHLAQRGCRGTGPDDCVLVSLLWSSLAPADHRLAAALRTIEGEVKPGSPLTAPAGTDADSQPGRRARLLHGLRQSAFLRAKMASMTAAPELWPADSVPPTLQQLVQLQAQLDLARNDTQFNWSRYEVPYYNEAIDPWPGLKGIAAHPAGAAALRTQLEAFPDGGNCEPQTLWLKQIPKPLTASIALAAWTNGRPTRCLQPDWEWLRSAPAAETRPVQAALAALVKGESGQIHEQVLDGLTAQGSACFGEGAKDTSAELRALCSAWISGPQEVTHLSAGSGRSVQAGDTFEPLTLPEMPATLIDEQPDIAQRHAAWLAGVLRPLGASENDAAAVTRAIRAAGKLLGGLQGWRSKDGKLQVLTVELMPARSDGGAPSAPPPWPYDNERLLLVLSPGRLIAAGMPGRFAYQYDAGAITRLTDIDHDGRPEVWLSGTFGECDGDDEQTEADCLTTINYMGEIWGDTLSYFAWTPTNAAPAANTRP